MIFELNQKLEQEKRQLEDNINKENQFNSW
jgi:hypothetical protein